RDGRPVVSDVNPRLGTSAVHWRGSGFNPALAVCADAGLVPEGAGGSPPPAGRRSVRHLEERVLPLTPGPSVGGIVFDLDATLSPTKRWLRDRLLRALDVEARASERDGARATALRVIEEGPRDRLIDAVAAALGWPEERRARLLELYRVSWPGRCATYPEVR